MSNSLKKAYGDRELYAARERRLSAAFTAESGIRLTSNGLGAGEALHYEGYAKAHGGESGDADYISECGNILVEITGSNVPLKKDAELWVNKFKCRNAFKKAQLSGKFSYVIHETPQRDGASIIRIIKFDSELFYRLAKLKKSQLFPLGIQQDFFCIPANDPNVFEFKMGCRDAKFTAAMADMISPLYRPGLEVELVEH